MLGHPNFHEFAETCTWKSTKSTRHVDGAKLMKLSPPKEACSSSFPLLKYFHLSDVYQPITTVITGGFRCLSHRMDQEATRTHRIVSFPPLLGVTPASPMGTEVPQKSHYQPLRNASNLFWAVVEMGDGHRWTRYHEWLSGHSGYWDEMKYANTLSDWACPTTNFIKDQNMHYHPPRSLYEHTHPMWNRMVIPSKRDLQGASFRWPFRQRYTGIPPGTTRGGSSVPTCAMRSFGQRSIPLSLISSISYQLFSIYYPYVNESCRIYLPFQPHNLFSVVFQKTNKKNKKQLYIQASQWERPQFWRFQLQSPR